MASRKILTRFPWIVVSAQTGCLMAAGDLISQTYVEKKNIRDVNIYRMMRFSALGAVFVGPTLSCWYKFMEKRIILKSAGATALAKMTADQTLFAPFFIAVIISVNGAISLKPWKQIQSELHRDYKEILINNYKLWPAVQLLNFWVIPLRFRVLFVQTVALFWNTYLSWMTNRR